MDPLYLRYRFDQRELIEARKTDFMDKPDPEKKEISEIIPDEGQNPEFDPDFDAGLELFGKALDLTKPRIQNIRNSGAPANSLLALKGFLGGKVDNSLFHYTSAEGIQGIIESGTLHATSGYFLNDSSEVDYGCQMFGTILNDWCEKNKNQNIAKGILERLRDTFGDLNQIRYRLGSVYVVCFCEEPNLLSQWRTYGQNGGYSIGFDRDGLGKYKAGNADATEARLEQVIYEETRQKMILEGLTGDGIPELEQPDLRSAFEKANERARKILVNMMASAWQMLALREIVRFKHPAFQDEREWRLITQPDYRFPRSSKEIDFIEFKALRGVPTPYIALKPDGGTHPITSVRYGPTLDRKRVEHGLSLLFKKAGYSEIKLLGSEIPIRL